MPNGMGLIMVTGATIVDNSITNADINSAAAIVYSKLSLADSIVNADIKSTAAIIYSKLSLADSLVNADIKSTAAIIYSKLSLADSLVNADINSAAAIEFSKLNSGAIGVDLVPANTLSKDIGSSSKTWNNIYTETAQVNVLSGNSLGQLLTMAFMTGV